MEAAILLPFARQRSRRQGKWQGDGAQPPTLQVHREPLFVSEQIEAEAQRAKALHEQPPLLRQPAAEAAAREVANPGFDAVTFRKGDVQPMLPFRRKAE